jgi:uncharacterized membrane protein
METSIRPLTLGEILDRTAQLYRTHFVLFAGISAVYAGVMLVLSLGQIGLGELMRVLHMDQQVPWVTLAFIVLIFPLSFICAGAAVAANNRAVAWVNLGERATIRGAYASILPRFKTYLWLMTIVGFIIWFPVILIYGGYFSVIFFYLRPMGLFAKAASPNPQVALMFLGISSIFGLLAIGWLVYAILMGLRYALAVPACVVEKLTARNAIRRSIDLSKGSRGRIFVLGLLVITIQFTLVLASQALFIVAAFKHHGVLPAWVRVLQQVVGFFTNTFIGPMYATGLTLFYYDQRVRKEGFDIEWMMQAAGLTVPAPPEAQAAPQAAPQAEPWLALDSHFEPAAHFEPPPASPPAAEPAAAAASHDAPPAEPHDSGESA